MAHLIWVILAFFAAKEEIRASPDDLAFTCIDYVNNIRKDSKSKRYYPDLWNNLAKRQNFNSYVRLIYDPLNEPIPEEKDEYVYYFWKLIDSVSAERKTFQDFLNQTGWKKLLTEDQKQILESRFKYPKKIDGLWIIPHKRIFAQAMGRYQGRFLEERRNKEVAQELCCFDRQIICSGSCILARITASELFRILSRIKRKKEFIKNHYCVVLLRYIVKFS